MKTPYQEGYDDGKHCLDPRYRDYKEEELQSYMRGFDAGLAWAKEVSEARDATGTWIDV